MVGSARFYPGRYIVRLHDHVGFSASSLPLFIRVRPFAHVHPLSTHVHYFSVPLVSCKIYVLLCRYIRICPGVGHIFRLGSLNFSHQICGCILSCPGSDVPFSYCLNLIIGQVKEVNLFVNSPFAPLHHSQPVFHLPLANKALPFLTEFRGSRISLNLSLRLSLNHRYTVFPCSPSSSLLKSARRLPYSAFIVTPFSIFKAEACSSNLSSSPLSPSRDPSNMIFLAAQPCSVILAINFTKVR